MLGAAEPDWLNPTGSAGPTPPDAPGNCLSAPQGVQGVPRPSASGPPPLPPFQSTGLAAFLATPAMRPASAAVAAVLSPQQHQEGQQCEIGVSELRGLPLDPGACINAGFDATGGERSGQQVQGHTYAVPVVPVVHEVPVVPRDPPESAISAPQPAGSRSVRQTRTSKVRRQCVCMCVVCVCGLYCTAANAAWHNRAHPPPVGMALLPGLCCL